MPQTTVPSRPLVVGCIMVSMSMVAMEMTIVSTAMPQIVSQLGGIQLYSWVFSAFVLTQTTMTVVFGKLADVYGRRPVMLTGISVFVVGSVIAGLASSMPFMIGARLIQGVGAGAIMPAALTIVGDLYPARERGKVQGYLASVWAVSAVVGPMVGGFIVRDFSWAWVFWINVPIGVAAAAGFIAFLRSDVQRSHLPIDYAGAALFTGAVAALMIALTDTHAASALRLTVCAGVFCVCATLFIMQERRARDPMISFALWQRRPIAAANGAAVVSGMALMGLTTFLPMYVQGVLHRTPVIAGLTLTMVMVGWPVGATGAARVFPRYGLRRIMLLGGLLVPTGAIAFYLLGSDSSPVLAAVGSIVMGFGMGMISVCSLIMIQELVAKDERASATASNLFARNLGSTLGAAVLGAIQSYGLSRATHFGTVTPDQLAQSLQSASGAANASASGTGLASLTADVALQHSLHLTFTALFVIALLSLVFTMMVPSVTVSRVEEVPAQ